MSILVCLLVGTCHSYPTYRDRIPNGYNVPHPCKDTIWEGVGHENEGGAGIRNAFGLDFKENGLVRNNEPVFAIDHTSISQYE